MKKFFIEVLIVFLICTSFLSLYRYVSTYVLNKHHGPSTEELIRKQFSDIEVQGDSIECIFLGSSRFARGITPELFDMCSYNFAHDNDSYNQMYYKLLYVHDRCPNLKRIVVCYDYVSFCNFTGTRNYVYHKYFPNVYTNDYSSNFYNNYIYPILKSAQNFSYVIRSFKNAVPVSYLTGKGQFVLNEGMASINDKITRSTDILQIQESYFNQIIEFTKLNNIDCWLVTMPIRDGEYKSYSNTFIDNMRRKALSYENIHYIDYSRNADFLKLEFFSDICHFNKQSADLFSKELSNVINQRK